LQSIRRGIQGFRQRARVAAAQRADDRGPDLFLLEQRSNPLAARCLAIGAGHAAHPQRFRRAAVKLVRDGTRAELEAGHGEVRYPPFAAPGETLLLPEHGRGPARDRIGYVSTAIRRLAWIREKCDPRRAAAAVGREPPDHRPLGSEAREELPVSHSSAEAITCSP